MLCSVTTMLSAGIRVAAYCWTSARLLTLNAGTVSTNDPSPATAAAAIAVRLQTCCQSERATSVHRKQYAGRRIRAKYCGNFKELRPKTTIPVTSQLNSSALPWTGCQLRAR